MSFNCIECGACCKLLTKIVKPEFDRGDGVCKHLKNNKCSIYEDRPTECRIDDLYDKYKDQIDMTRQEYYKWQDGACHLMQIRVEELGL